MAYYWWLKKGLGVEFVKQDIGMLKYDKNNDSSYIEHLDANNLYGWAMSQKLPVKDFKWVKKKKLSEFNEDFIKKYDKGSNTVYFYLK